MIDYVKLNSLGIKKVLYVDSTESTNSLAKIHSEEDDMLVVAGHQIAGKGRFNRKWVSEKDMGVTLSIIKSFNVELPHLLNFYASYIVQRTLKEYIFNIFGTDQDVFRLKWPNDILLGKKKVAGILSEVMRINENPRKFIIGIGINVNQESFPEEISEKAISLKMHYRRDFSVYDIIYNLLNQFYSNLSLVGQTDILMELWRLNSDIVGKLVTFRINNENDSFKGKIIEISNDGGIKIELSDNSNSKNISTFYTGEISFIY